MALIDNITSVSLASKYPTDKIVGREVGTFAPASATTVGSLRRYDIAHSFTRPVFTRLKWSLDGIVWADGGQGKISGDSSLISTMAYSDSSQLHILTGATSGTIHYELLSFWIDDYDTSNPAIPAYSAYTTKPFAFDSRLNYQKIYRQGEVTLTGTTLQTITHDLGEVGNVWVYFEALTGEVWPAISGGLNNYFLYDLTNQNELDVRIYPSELYLDPFAGAAGSFRAWYNIYTP